MAARRLSLIGIKRPLKPRAVWPPGHEGSNAGSLPGLTGARKSHAAPRLTDVPQNGQIVPFAL